MSSFRCLSVRSAIVALLVGLSIVVQAGWSPVVQAAAHPLRFGVTTPSGPLSYQEISGVAEAAGEWPQMELWYSDFSQSAPIEALDAVWRRGAEPVITWEPWTWDGGLSQPEYSLDRITAGDFDQYLRSWAAALKAWGHPVTIRFAHEMNGNWYPWSEGVNGNGTGDFVAAWRHVHDVFATTGAVAVRWMWSPNVPYDGSVPLGETYPGADYVDVVALDGYNWGSTQAWSSWTTPSALFGPGLTELRTQAPDKPIVVAETASAGAGGDEAAWIAELVGYLDGQPDVTGFVWFHHDKEVDWRFTSSASASGAMAAALAGRRSAGATGWPT